MSWLMFRFSSQTMRSPETDGYLCPSPRPQPSGLRCRGRSNSRSTFRSFRPPRQPYPRRCRDAPAILHRYRSKRYPPGPSPRPWQAMPVILWQWRVQITISALTCSHSCITTMRTPPSSHAMVSVCTPGKRGSPRWRINGNPVEFRRITGTPQDKGFARCRIELAI